MRDVIRPGDRTGGRAASATTDRGPCTATRSAPYARIWRNFAAGAAAGAKTVQVMPPRAAYAAADAPAFPDESSTRWVAPYARATLARTAMPRSL